MPTVRLSPDTLERFDWYRTNFNMTSDQLLNFIMTKLEFATIKEIRQHKLSFRQEPPTEEATAKGGS